MLVSKERRKPEYPEKKPSGSRVENQQQTQPTYDAGEASALTSAPTLLPYCGMKRSKSRLVLIRELIINDSLEDLSYNWNY